MSDVSSSISKTGPRSVQEWIDERPQWAAAPDEENASDLAAEHFIPLPPQVWVKSHDQIERIR